MINKHITNHRKKTNKVVVFSCRYLPKLSNTGTINETFQQSGKQDSLRHILNSLANMYEGSGSQFFKTTPGRQSGPEAFDESMLVMTFLTNLGVT